MKKAISFVLVLFVIATLSAPAYAEEPTRVGSVNTTLSFNGTTAYCEVIVIATGKDIRASVSLWEGNILVESWYESGTSFLPISKSASVMSGHTYTMYVSVTIDGNAVYVPSTTKTCP